MDKDISPPAFLAEICNRLGPHLNAADDLLMQQSLERGPTDADKQYWANRIAADITRRLVETSWTIAFTVADEHVRSLSSPVELATLRQTLTQQFELSARYLRDQGGIAAAVYAEQIPAFGDQLDAFLIAHAPPQAWQLPTWVTDLTAARPN